MQNVYIKFGHRVGFGHSKPAAEVNRLNQHPCKLVKSFGNIEAMSRILCYIFCVNNLRTEVNENAVDQSCRIFCHYRVALTE